MREIEVPNWLGSVWLFITWPQLKVQMWLRRRRFNKLRLKWNADVERINQWIAEGITQEHSSFVWGQIVWQEVKWCVEYNEVMTARELRMLSERRGFTAAQRAYIVEFLTYMGLWDGDEDGK